MQHTFSFNLDSVHINGSVITTWGIMLLLAVVAWLSTRNLKLFPTPQQTLMEGIVVMIDEAIAAVATEHSRTIMPFVATLWIFLTIANLVGLVPGLHSPSRDLSVTSALAMLVFFSVYWFGIKVQGLKKYLHHYLMPSPILLPFHIISELTRTVALAIRLFGNIMSLETAAMLVLFVAGFLAPIPILMLHIIEALVQAYIFGMLALIYLASAIQTQQSHIQK
jgi:F-type H+-transporting ATPase subunit a